MQFDYAANLAARVVIWLFVFVSLRFRNIPACAERTIKHDSQITTRDEKPNPLNLTQLSLNFQ